MIQRSSLTWPIFLAVVLLVLIVALLIFWIIGQAATQQWGLLALGTVFFGLVLIGIVMYMLLTIKEINLNRRQANFIDSVTHELKSPIASIKLYLQTLDMRDVPVEQQREFHRFMLDDVRRLDALIDHLLVAARLDHVETDLRDEEVALEPLLRSCVETVSRRYDLKAEQIRQVTLPAVVTGKARELEMIFLNLLDNAVKYAGEVPEVVVQVVPQNAHTIVVRISDNGKGVRFELRNKIFNRFFRGGSELERTAKGTGLGLYIVKSLVKKMRGKVSVHGRGPLTGATFEVALPGRQLELPPLAAEATSPPAR